MSVFEQLLKDNPDKYPSRLGAPWDDDEQKQLLKSIAKGMSINDIAKEHDRTVGGIRARLRHIAVEYYNKDYSIDDIEQLTGLEKDIIGKDIAKHLYNKEHPKREKMVKKLENKNKITKPDNNIINVLNDIKVSIDKLINILEKQQN